MGHGTVQSAFSTLEGLAGGHKVEALKSAINKQSAWEYLALKIPKGLLFM